MINLFSTNIFSSEADAIVNPVNTVGIMGAGLALAFKTRYPKMFESYRIACADKVLTVGKLHYFQTEDKIIINFPTKSHWKTPSTIEYIEQGLEFFVHSYQEYSISSVAFPALGCGLGGLKWEEVYPVMVSYLETLPIKIDIHLNYR